MLHVWRYSLLTLCLTPALAGDIPSPVQAGAPRNCESWIAAGPGDTCDSIGKAHNMDVKHFLRINPQLKNDCSNLLWSGYHYCVGVSGAEPTTRASAIPAKTHTVTIPRKTTEPIVKKPSTAKPPPTTSAPKPPAITCTYDMCYNMLEVNGQQDPPGVSAMCKDYFKEKRAESDVFKLFSSLSKPEPKYVSDF
ncbi:hypothetical protein DL770_009309 [Monosporascus sp. CRB-9-2]|nr:hypothetical protein DL770_009309 [Monosporascus sp. CRB-9-2]